MFAPTACVSDDQGADGQDAAADELGEDLGDELGSCPNERQALLAFDLEDGALATSTIELPSESWRLWGKLGHGDFDGDGITDLVFGPRVVFGPIGPSSEVVEFDIADLDFTDALAVDLDGDGRDELAVALQEHLDSTPHLRLVECSAERELNLLDVPTWNTSSSSGLLELAAGDVSGDGHTDLVLGVANFSLDEKSGQMAVLRGDGAKGFEGVDVLHYADSKGSFQRVVTLNVAQVDGVGGLDILSARSIDGDKLGFLLTTTGVSEGAIQNTQVDIEAPGTSLLASTFADLDLDGHLDALVLGSQLEVAPGLEGGGFGDWSVAFTAKVSSPNRSTLTVADLDDDGVPDLMAATGIEAGDVALAQGLEGGALAEPLFGEAPESNGRLWGAKVFDVDNDGDLEVVAAASWCEGL